MMYDVCMRRTNVYLEERQLESLRLLGAQRGEPVAGLVRQAVDEWLERHGVRRVTEDEWRRRFTALLDRRAIVAEQVAADETQVAADVADALAEVRSERAAGAGGR